MHQELLPETLPVHIDSLRRAARGMTRTREDAEDLVQDTLLKVLARPRQIGPAGAGPYLHQALRNTHVSSLRTRDRRPVLAPLEPEDSRLVAPSAGEPVEILHTREVIDAIRCPAAGAARGRGRRRRRRVRLQRGRRPPADPGRDRDEPPPPRPRAPRLLRAGRVGVWRRAASARVAANARRYADGDVRMIEAK